ncbi:hypothetical protein AALO_G00117080 [Alosa alosa]|uniref:Uncharacterized protein n=1 Tax=Alosa alosa TaxID=278164 RepID=A0AAV6GV06_9TELE|nr:hypothetical protein AALO_G00117080 [Alosa alosa]
MMFKDLCTLHSTHCMYMFTGVCVCVCVFGWKSDKCFVAVFSVLVMLMDELQQMFFGELLRVDPCLGIMNFDPFLPCPEDSLLMADTESDTETNTYTRRTKEPCGEKTFCAHAVN